MEHGQDPGDLRSLKNEIEKLLREKLIFSSDEVGSSGPMDARLYPPKSIGTLLVCGTTNTIYTKKEKLNRIGADSYVKKYLDLRPDAAFLTVNDCTIVEHEA